MNVKRYLDRFNLKAEPSRPYSESLSVTQIYKISTSTLKEFFGSELTEGERAAKLNQEFGGVHGILKSLQSEAGTGIMGDERDLKRRETFFGSNLKPAPMYPSFMASVKQSMNEKIH